MDRPEEIAREFIEGVGGLFDLYKYEMGVAHSKPPEVEGARYMILCLINPKRRAVLDEIIEQSDIRIGENENEL